VRGKQSPDKKTELRTFARHKKGDVVNIPENVEHWHGASSGKSMSHIAITNYKDDVQVTWLQPVSDEEYRNTEGN
jgi:cupin superfamily acireductone dioxygenase involved in methionine salvage